MGLGRTGETGLDARAGPCLCENISQVKCFMVWYSRLRRNFMKYASRMPPSTADPSSSTRAPNKITVTLAADSKPLQYVDGVREPVRLLHQGLSAVVRVAQSDDAAMVLKAGIWLVEYATVQLGIREQQKAAAEARRRILPAGPDSRDVILSELKGLYEKALGGHRNLVVDVTAESAPPETAKNR